MSIENTFSNGGLSLEEFYRNFVLPPEILDKVIAEKKLDAIKNFTIYRNGIYTTVKWGDGTVTTVKRQPDDKDDDIRAFEEALAKKICGSRSALKRIVAKNTVDVAVLKETKKSKKQYKEDKRRRAKGEVIARDSNGVELCVGDHVYIKDFSDIDLDGGIYRVDEIRNYTATVSEYVLPSECFTKVKTEPPFLVGDYVVFDNPKENHLADSNAWTSHMSADTPLKIEKISGTNLLCSDGCVYETLWIRGLPCF